MRVAGISRVINVIEIEVEQIQRYLSENLEMKDEGRFKCAVTNIEELLIVMDGGLRNKRVFGWVVAIHEEIIAICYGQVKGRIKMMSSFRTEATGMYARMFLIGKKR